MDTIITDNHGKSISKKTRGLNDGKITVYFIKTAEPSKCFPVDAKERVKTGEWSYKKPEKKKRSVKKAVTYDTDIDS